MWTSRNTISASDRSMVSCEKGHAISGNVQNWVQSLLNFITEFFIKKTLCLNHSYLYRTKRIQEHGLQYRENRLMYEKRPKCSGGGSNFVSVSMVDCYPAVLILTYGAITALFLLALEILIYKREKLMRCLKHNNYQ